ncbi:MAG: tetratricopeptide repeat protein [Cyclobacteriaceae bacterium]|nr:tetratricopeptide repeat protein [Cyclobacteriaceae bacterium]
MPANFFNPYFLGLVIFAVMYLRLCNNDSNLTGNKHFENGEYQLALEHYDEYLMLYPEDVKTRYNRGRCLESLGKNDAACRDFEQVLQLDPHNTKATLSLSQHHFHKAEFKSALLYANYAVQLDKKSALGYYYQARANHKLGYFNEALSAYNTAIELDPEFGFAYFQRSSLLLSIGLRPLGCYDLRMAQSLHVQGAAEALDLYCKN